MSHTVECPHCGGINSELQELGWEEGVNTLYCGECGESFDVEFMISYDYLPIKREVANDN
ncbi:hypothetical protein [Cetobacterium sp.]|uniref:hypothetical protein n=1 Tax=Cetobacterium sp. TaxID=2071632 RepID=UPI003F4029B3